MKIFKLVFLLIASFSAMGDEGPCPDEKHSEFQATVVGDNPVNASAHFLQACYNFQQIWGVEAMSERRVVAVVMTPDRTELSRFEGVCGDEPIDLEALEPKAEREGMMPTSFYWR